MFRVHIISAENLPVPTKNERKTKIFCFSESSCPYIYDSFKNDENTRNPKWNKSFDADLFRCSKLTFKLFSSRLFSKNIFLGELTIDISTFLVQSPGNEILRAPYGNIRCEFPLTSCNSPNAILSLSFLFIPKTYCPIQFKDVSGPMIHHWATFTPSLEGINNNIEIELLQINVTKDKKSKNGFFFNLNNQHSWESVGYSSSSLTFLGPTGFSPVRTFFLDRINSTFNFFIVNVSNYSGIITLNFVAEKRGKTDSFDDKMYISPKKEKNNKIGTVKTVDIKVEPNKKYCAPAYLFFEKKFLKTTFEISQFQQLSTILDHSKSEIIDHLCSEMSFQSSIVEVAQSEIEDLNDANITKTFVLPKDEKVPIQKVFNEFNLQQRAQIRIYINGSTTVSTGQSSYTNFWRPIFTIFDLNTGQTCPEISKKLSKKPLFHFHSLFEKSPIPIEWHSYVDLDLDDIGIDKAVVFSIGCLSTLDSASPPGMIFITRTEGENETVLFRNPIYVDTCRTYWSSFLRFEFIEDSWNVIQMRFPFTKKKKFEFGINTLFRNNWVMPEILLDEDDDNSGPGSSDKEFLLDEI